MKSPPDAAAERCFLATLAHLLDTGRGIAAVSLPLTVAALAALAAPLLLHVPLAGVLALLLAGVAGLAGSYVGARVALDAALFRDLAEGRADWARLDGALGRLGFLPPEKAGREAELRAAGAKRLLRWQAVLLVLQAAAFLAAGIAGMLAGTVGGARP